MKISQVLARKFKNREWTCTDSEGVYTFLDNGPVPSIEDLQALWPDVESQLQAETDYTNRVKDGLEILKNLSMLMATQTVEFQLQFAQAITAVVSFLQVGGIEAAKLVVASVQVDPQDEPLKASLLEVFDAS